MPPERSLRDSRPMTSGNPVALASIFTSLGFVARLLVKLGVPNYLREQAAKTETKWDDFLATAVASAIENAAEL